MLNHAQPKPPAVLHREREAKIRRLRERLSAMREYKRLLAETGEEPDAEDKRRESELIVQVLRLEKGLSAKAPPKNRGKK